MRSLCTTKTLDAFSLLRLAQGRDYYLCRSPADIALVETCADAELEALDRRLGPPFIEYLFQFGRRNLQLSDLRSLAATCGDETGDRYRMLLTEYSEYDLPGLLVPKKRGLFGSVLPVSEWQSIKWPKLLVCMHSVAVWLLDPIVRDCENAYRRLKGVPEIGQGWTSESLLFSLISDRFPREELVFHGTPPWLGLQHPVSYTHLRA
ncbi:MAG: hypothetical protein QUS09_00815, partial [Methanotrichaceae archaeon]|nr:hypothetical protein [Methanotrichaceae archaeon]